MPKKTSGITAWKHAKAHVKEMVRTDMHRTSADVTVRVVVAGDGAVGKSMLIQRLRHGDLDDVDYHNCERPAQNAIAPSEPAVTTPACL